SLTHSRLSEAECAVAFCAAARKTLRDRHCGRRQIYGHKNSKRKATSIKALGLKDSYIVSMVPVNHEVRKPEAFDDQIPVKEIQLDPQDYKTSWHTHLGIYRKAQAKSQKLYDVSSLSNVERDIVNQESSADKDLSSVREISTSDKQHDFVTFVPRKFSASGSLSRQLSIVSYKPPASSSKLCYYPFPQRKCPKKSEAARRLGLYATY
uniref:TBC1 domain-containing protein n=1 Tax=Erpetoichthys calabaricus TaxID=27687 RepID=A0A8C4SAF7_ERPCA